VLFVGDDWAEDVLRASIEARLRGKKTAIISKSLFGKAHTVMAEGMREAHAQVIRSAEAELLAEHDLS
jgi:hypothetical protein